MKVWEGEVPLYRLFINICGKVCVGGGRGVKRVGEWAHYKGYTRR